MTVPRPCGCKGCRTCLICETEHGADNLKLQLTLDQNKGYVYCPFCNKAWKGWDLNSYKTHPYHEGEPIEFPGIFIKLDFLSENEEKSLIKNLDDIPWDISQSGRRKQNYGPKTNFKKRKIAAGNFNGFPECTKFIQDRFSDEQLLKDYETIEQCSLEYDPAKGASIDPHIDDCWIWGERIVTVNCLSDSVLTLTPFNCENRKYNIQDAETYCSVFAKDGEVNTEFRANETNVLELSKPKIFEDVIVRVPMPRYSLLIIYGAPRYHWEHFVLREDISSRRVCIAYREFTPPYMTNGPHQTIGAVVREKAKNFWCHKKKYSIPY